MSNRDPYFHLPSTTNTKKEKDPPLYMYNNE